MGSPATSIFPEPVESIVSRLLFVAFVISSLPLLVIDPSTPVIVSAETVLFSLIVTFVLSLVLIPPSQVILTSIVRVPLPLAPESEVQRVILNASESVLVI